MVSFQRGSRVFSSVLLLALWLPTCQQGVEAGRCQSQGGVQVRNLTAMQTWGRLTALCHGWLCTELLARVTTRNQSLACLDDAIRIAEAIGIGRPQPACLQHLHHQAVARQGLQAGLMGGGSSTAAVLAGCRLPAWPPRRRCSFQYTGGSGLVASKLIAGLARQCSASQFSFEE